MTEISTVRPAVNAELKTLRVPDRTLALLRDLVLQHTGMYYDESRLDFLRDRLGARAVEHGFDSLLDYYYLLKYDDGAAEEWVHAIDALSVQETYFWREADQIHALTEAIMPALAEGRRTPVRIASVPCASGEEPLSLAIALTEAGWFDRVPIQILAGDASEAALARARAGRYGARSFRQLPDHLRDKYFQHDEPHREWIVNPEVHRRVTTWSRLNVVRHEDLASLRGCDVIFCRNLFIYFNHATVARVVEAFADLMPARAWLCVGAAESLLRTTTRFELREMAGAYVYEKS